MPIPPLVAIPISGYEFILDFPAAMLWNMFLSVLLLSIICLGVLHKLTQKTETLTQIHATLDAERAARQRIETQLQTQEANYRLLVDHHNDLIVQFDSSQHLLFANQSYCRTFGATATELLGQRFMPLIHEDDRETVQASLARLRTPPYTCAHEERAKTVDGWRWFSWSNRALVDERGAIQKILAVGRDITAQKQIEFALRDSETRLRKLFDEAIDGIALADADTGILLDCNRTLADMVEREKAELIGQPQTMLHPPREIRDRFSVTFEQHRSDADGQVLETQLITKTGVIKDVEIKASVIELYGKHVVQGIVRDITERKRAQEAVRQLARFPGENPNPVLRVNPQGLIIYANTASAELLAYWQRQVRQPLPDPWCERAVEAFEAQRLIVVEIACRARVFALTFAPIADAACVNIYGMDITARKQVEDDLARYQNHLEQLVEERTSHLRQEVAERQQAEQALQEHERRTRLLKDVAVAANTASDHEQALQRAIEQVCAYTHWPIGHVYQLRAGDSAELLQPTRIWHLDEPDTFGAFMRLTEQARFRSGEGLPGRVLLTGRPAWIEDVQQDHSFLRAHLISDVAVHGAFAFPVMVDREVVAVLEFFSTLPEQPDEPLLEIMAQVGFQLGLVIRRQRAEAQLYQLNQQLEARVTARTQELQQANEALIVAKEASETARQTAETARQAAEAARQAADVANQAKSLFLANMSHELRTPLNVMLGFVQLLERNPLVPADQQEYLTIIGRSGHHLLRLINDVLELSKIEAGQSRVELTTVNLHYLLTELMDMVRFRAEKKGLRMLYQPDPELPPGIRTDEGRLRQTLLNLLGNAVKFTEKGSVTLKILACEPVQGQVEKCELLDLSQAIAPNQKSHIKNLKFEISDTGPGISAEEQPDLFKAFTQTSTGQNAQEGTGLGLSISQRFVQLLGGELKVRSQVGQGSTFYFTIPCELVEDGSIAYVHSERRVIGLQPGQPEYRMLIVDDNAESRLLLRILLEGIGFEVFEAVDGNQAIEQYCAAAPDMIWMDMRMPDVDGYDATNRIRELECYAAHGTRHTENPVRPIPIIALTASAFEENRETALTAGCTDFMRKPFQASEIFKIIHTHLGVEYEYDDDESAVFEADDVPLEPVSPDMLQGIPDELLDDLVQAAQRTNLTRIAALIEQIRPYQHSLADALAAWTKNYDYDRILAVLKQSGPE